MNFASDNAAEIAPEIFDAIARANKGYALAYGNDDLTRALDRRMSELFEREVAAFLVATGTAANALAIAHFCQPWNAVLCHEASHLMTDEAGAPEFFGGGLKLIGIAGDDGKIAPDALKQTIGRGRGVPPQRDPRPRLAQPVDGVRHRLPQRGSALAYRCRA